MSTHVHDVDPDEEAQHTDALLARDAEALTLVKALDQADEHLTHWTAEKERIKAQLLDLLPDGGRAGDRTVQVTRPRRLDEQAFTQAYPVTAHPEMYAPKVALAEVKRHLAPVELDRYYRAGGPVLKVL